MASSQQQVKLLGSWASPFVIRVRIALNVKSIEYDFLEEAFGTKSDLLLKSNPVYKKIPVLIHGENPICESLIIVQYLDEVWSSGHSILPSDPYDRATARFWAAYIDDKFFPQMRSMLLVDDEAKKAAIEETTRGLGLLEDAFSKCSKGGVFFGGDKIGYLDVALGGLLAWVRAIEKISSVSFIDESKTPNLFKWAESFSADAAVKDVLPETNKLVEFSKKLVARLKGN